MFYRPSDSFKSRDASTSKKQWIRWPLNSLLSTLNNCLVNVETWSLTRTGCNCGSVPGLQGEISS